MDNWLSSERCRERSRRDAELWIAICAGQGRPSEAGIAGRGTAGATNAAGVTVKCDAGKGRMACQ